MNEKLSVGYLYDYVKRRVNMVDFVETELQCDIKWLKMEESARCICPMPDHKDSKPSFQMDYKEESGMWLFYCLGGETRVLTYDGPVPIKDLDGTTQKILTEGQKWVDAPFYNYGKQTLSKITLTRNQQVKEIFATNEHRWFVNGKRNSQAKMKTTEQLKGGDVLKSVFPKKNLHHIKELSPQGVCHGMVYGDGTAPLNCKSASINLWGHKNKELASWFPLNRKTAISQNGLGGLSVVNLPAYYKQKPPLEESSAYLYGFLAGWLAADGHVAKDGTIMLNSSKKEDLEFARIVAMRIGIGTYGITEQRRVGIDNRESSLYRIHFINEDVEDRLFLINEHKSRFKSANKKYSKRRWVVRSVEMDVKKDYVYCAEVDGTHNFVLEDNILTGNCFGCGGNGTIIDFCQRYYGLESPAEAVLFLCKKMGFKENSEVIVDCLKDVRKRVDLNKKIECSNIVVSNQCRMLLRRDYENNVKWVSSAYKRLNAALEKDDFAVVEKIGYEAHERMG